MAYDSCWVSIVIISNNVKDILNHSDDFNVATYWSRCLDSYWWGVKVTVFWREPNFTRFVANGDKTVIMLLLLCWCYCSFLSMVLLDRISKVYEMVYLWWKCRNSTVFRFRILNRICTSSDEKYTGEKWSVVNDKCRRNSRRTWGNWPYHTLVISRSSRTSSKQRFVTQDWPINFLVGQYP